MTNNKEQRIARAAAIDRLLAHLGCRDIACLDAESGLWRGSSRDKAPLDGRWGAVLSESFSSAWSFVQAAVAAGTVPDNMTKLALLWREKGDCEEEPLVAAGIPVLWNSRRPGSSTLESACLGGYDAEREGFVVFGDSLAGDEDGAASNLSALAEEICCCGCLEYPENGDARGFSDMAEVFKFASLLFEMELPDVSALDTGRYGRWNAPEASFFSYKGSPGSLTRQIYDAREDAMSAMRIWGAFEDTTGLFFSRYEPYAFDGQLAYDIICSSGLDIPRARRLSARKSGFGKEMLEGIDIVPDLWRSDDGEVGKPAAETPVSAAFQRVLGDCGLNDLVCNIIRWPGREGIPDVEHVYMPMDGLSDKDDIPGRWAVMFLATEVWSEPGEMEMLAMMACGELPDDVSKALVVNFGSGYRKLPDGFLENAANEFSKAGVATVIDLTGRGRKFGEDGTERLEAHEGEDGELRYVIRHPERVLPHVIEGLHRQVFDYRISLMLWELSQGVCHEGVSEEVVEALSFGMLEVPEELAGEMPVPMSPSHLDGICHLFLPCYDDESERRRELLGRVSDLVLIWVETLDDTKMDISSVFPAGTPRAAVEYLGRLLGVDAAVEAYLSGVPVEDVLGSHSS